MSIASMANVAYVRRNDVSTPEVGKGSAPTTAGEIESATSGTVESQSAATTALKVIATYIPTEILTLYIAVIGALDGPNGTSERSLWIAFFFFLGLTPLIVWLHQNW